jgi:hypothetical protein
MYLKKLCHPRTTSFAQFNETSSEHFQQALSQPQMTAMTAIVKKNCPFKGAVPPAFRLFFMNKFSPSHRVSH